MRRLPLIVATLTACGRLDHVPPQPRSPDAQRITVVRVLTSCSEPDMMSPEWNSDIPGQRNLAPDIDWAPPGYGTGVVISEKDVLTAGHVVGCPIIPDVNVVLANGSNWPVQVIRDARMFGDGTDVARLTAIGAYDRFRLNIPPPALTRIDYDDFLCVQPFGRNAVCGKMVGRNLIGAPTRIGDSGAPVYEAGYDDGNLGALVGLVVAGDGTVTQFVPLDQSWLEGT